MHQGIDQRSLICSALLTATHSCCTLTARERCSLRNSRSEKWARAVPVCASEELRLDARLYNLLALRATATQAEREGLF